MRWLFLRVALWIFLSVGVAKFAYVWLTMPSFDGFGEDVARYHVATGLGALRDDLLAVPADARQAELDRVRDRYGMPLVLEPGSLPDDRPDSEFSEAGWFVLVPTGDMVLRVGPFPKRPHDTPVVVPFLAVVGIVLAASSVVVLPLARRMQALGRASAAVRAGALNTRVGDKGSDLLAEVGQAFDAMAEALERRFKDREELLQAVSHEFGTPLARMAFQIELLEARTTEQASLDRIRDMRRELAELDQLTAELVAWVELEGDPSLGAESDVDDLIDEAVGRATPYDGLVTTLRVGVPRGPVPGHPTRLGRAVDNVLRNAVRYAKGHVVLVREATDDEVRIIVDDDGPGVPEAERERVFEPFTRLDSSRAREGGGCGLGLAIVRRTAERHGGTATCTASPLGGARFTLTLPTRATRPG